MEPRVFIQDRVLSLKETAGPANCTVEHGSALTGNAPGQSQAAWIPRPALSFTKCILDFVF